MKTIIQHLQTIFSGKKGERLFHVCYSWGAALVLVGAMFKILHFPYANLILMIAMSVEAFIFFISGFDFPDEEVTETSHADLDQYEKKIDQLSNQLNQLSSFVNQMDRELRDFRRKEEPGMGDDENEILT